MLWVPWKLLGIFRHEFMAYRGIRRADLPASPHQIDQLLPAARYADVSSSARRGRAFVVLTELPFAVLNASARVRMADLPPALTRPCAALRVCEWQT